MEHVDLGSMLAIGGALAGLIATTWRVGSRVASMTAAVTALREGLTEHRAATDARLARLEATTQAAALRCAEIHGG